MRAIIRAALVSALLTTIAGSAMADPGATRGINSNIDLHSGAGVQKFFAPERLSGG